MVGNHGDQESEQRLQGCHWVCGAVTVLSEPWAYWSPNTPHEIFPRYVLITEQECPADSHGEGFSDSHPLILDFHDPSWQLS